MDSIDAYLVSRCLMLAGALRSLDDLDPDARADALQDAADLLDLLAEALAEGDSNSG